MPRAMAPPPSGEFSVRLTQSFGPHYLDDYYVVDPSIRKIDMNGQTSRQLRKSKSLESPTDQQTSR